MLIFASINASSSTPFALMLFRNSRFTLAENSDPTEGISLSPE